LLPYLRSALRLADSSFACAHAIDVEVETDPETGDQRLLIDVALDQSVEDVLAQYDAYVKQWVALAPPQVRHRIGLSYDIRKAG
jgi:hypothetical protein